MNSVIRSIKGVDDPSIWETLPVFLRLSCEPIRQWLQNPKVIEIMVNRPGEVWIEELGVPELRSFAVPALTKDEIRTIAVRHRRREERRLLVDRLLCEGGDAARRAVPGSSVASLAIGRRVLDPQASDLGFEPRRLRYHGRI